MADGSFAEDSAQTEESILFEDIPDLQKESVPIIDVGGLDPVMAVYEEEETLKLRESSEEFETVAEDEDEKEQPIREIVRVRAGDAIKADAAAYAPPQQIIVQPAAQSPPGIPGAGSAPLFSPNGARDGVHHFVAAKHICALGRFGADSPTGVCGDRYRRWLRG